jgi:hypothetical protein
MQRLVIRGLIGVGIVVGAAIVSMISGILPIGGGGDGDGSESTTPAETVVEPVEPAEPVAAPAEPLDKQLIVTTDDRRFLVEGQEKTADEIAQLAAQVPDEFSVKVIIICKDTSRADAENELADKLDSQGISHEMKDE